MLAEAISAEPYCAPRRGVAELTRLAYSGADLVPLYATLTRGCRFDAAAAGDVMDLALLAQLLGDPASGLRLQSRILDVQHLFRPAARPPRPRLRLLALAADLDIGGNTPVEFLLRDSDVELTTLYLGANCAFGPLPAHDLAMVIMPDDDRCRPVLTALRSAAANWPCPVINRPEAIARLDRDRLRDAIGDAPGVVVPTTVKVRRDELARLTALPMVIRPVGSHAGKGLARIDRLSQIRPYLEQCANEEFFVSPFVDYRSADGLFRKYRVVLIGGKPYPVHMALGPAWALWYLNAEMEKTPARRAEEQAFMDGFSAGFAARHDNAFAAIAERMGLDYFGLDCAETRDRELLVFEADNTLIVHDMDPPAIFPYKAPHMRQLFSAFQHMLLQRARRG